MEESNQEEICKWYGKKIFFKYSTRWELVGNERKTLIYIYKKLPLRTINGRWLFFGQKYLLIFAELSLHWSSLSPLFTHYWWFKFSTIIYIDISIWLMLKPKMCPMLSIILVISFSPHLFYLAFLEYFLILFHIFF